MYFLHKHCIYCILQVINSMKLLIVESPSKAKTIEKYLGAGFVVRASVGHIRDLPKSNKLAIDIPNGFKPTYELSPKKVLVVKELTQLAKKATEVLLATDPDREGEAISWHILDTLKLGPNTKRVAFNEITKEAVEAAIAKPRTIDMNLVRAQEARRVLDRLVGYDLSGIIWKKVRYGLSAGRVQSPALRIIMEREREIRAFIPVTYYSISADFAHTKSILSLVCEIEPTEKVEAERIVEVSKKEKWNVVDVNSTEAKRSPKAPFTTSTLQQTASSRLGFAPKRTMSAAQKLYEKGHITYMRTDSTTLSAASLSDIHATVVKKYGKELVEVRTFKTKSKNAQEAHEAVRPTHASTLKAGASDDEQRLYSLIWARTMASQMSDAKILRSKISANVTNKNIPNFSVNGSVLLSPGWLLADPGARGEDIELPQVTVGDALTLKNINSEEKQTQPPGRYSEAGLIKELEKRGIGRPSTYAAIISTIEDRGYVEKISKALHPTDTGDVVSSFLEANFAHYIGDTFTADMEDQLDDIASGKRTYEKTLGDFYAPFQIELKEKDKLAKATDLGAADPTILCPVCSKSMIIKLAKNGRFLSCSDFPECIGARKIDGTEMEPPKDIGRVCPKCNKKNLIEREGRFGLFIACSNYPKCKYIEKSPEEEAKGKTGVMCIKCDGGEMAERRGRFGLFYSCSNYPDCKAIIKTKPTGNICDYVREDKEDQRCGELMMEGTKTIPERCSDKTCPNHNPHKLDK
jgi:DNA topoisomerase I